jgi:hypothetical protein
LINAGWDVVKQMLNPIHAMPMVAPRKTAAVVVQPGQLYTVERNDVEYKLQDYMTVRPGAAPYASTNELYSKRLWIV